MRSKYALDQLSLTIKIWPFEGATMLINSKPNLLIDTVMPQVSSLGIDTNHIPANLIRGTVLVHKFYKVKYFRWAFVRVWRTGTLANTLWTFNLKWNCVTLPHFTYYVLLYVMSNMKLAYQSWCLQFPAKSQSRRPCVGIEVSRLSSLLQGYREVDRLMVRGIPSRYSRDSDDVVIRQGSQLPSRVPD